MNYNSKHTLFLAILLLGLGSNSQAKDDRPHLLAKPSTVEFELFTGNNISNWIGNQGNLTTHRAISNSGCEWPAGSGKRVIFASGIWVIGQVDGETRSAAVEYASEWTPGVIPYDAQTKLPIGTTPLNTPDHQIYYIKKGNSADPSSEDYNREYASWPASDGAPAHDGEYFTDLNSNDVWDSGESFEDFDGDGSYDLPDGLLVTGEDPPSFLGDTQAWYVMSDWDTTAHNNFLRTAPLGLETQVLIYTRSDDPIYENVQFHTITLVNKGGQPIDSAYFTYWTDPDIGNASDDMGGCDPNLSMAYFYNGLAHDQVYGLTPPAVGYTILRGPLVESLGDTVQVGGFSYDDKRLLGMTASILFFKSTAAFDDPEHVSEAYYYSQGLLGNGDPILDPFGIPTPFNVSGDPVVGEVWTAMGGYRVGDKRGMMSTGPFDLPPWDDVNGNGRADFGEPGVQTIHSALIIVDGADHLNAVTNLKYVSGYTQAAFDSGFETFTMEKPQLSASSHDQEIILNWYEGADEYEATALGYYEFEGYNLYQGYSAAGPWTRLATIDVSNGVGVIDDLQYNDQGYLETRVVQEGADSGLEHLISISSDALNDDEPLINNKAYYFALSAYAYNSDTSPKTLESEKQIVSIRPHLTWDSAYPRDSLTVSRPDGGELFIAVDVREPTRLTGLDYEIGFEYDSSISKGRWHLLSGGALSLDTLYRSDWFAKWERNWSGNGHQLGENPRFYFDGFELSLNDISFRNPVQNHYWEQTINVRGDSSWIESYLAVSPGGVDSLLIMGSDTVLLNDIMPALEWWELPEYSIREVGDVTWFDVTFRESHSIFFVDKDSQFGPAGGDPIAVLLPPFIGGGSSNLEFLQSDIELRFTEAGQTASLYAAATGYNPVLIHIPYEVWDIERNIQLCVGINDNNRSGGNQDTTKDDWENTLDLDWVIIFDRDYAIYGSEVDSLFSNPHAGWTWQFDDESKFSIGDMVSIQFLNPVKAGVDVYSWSTEVAGTAYDEDALDMIQVFPNPYFGYQSEQSSIFDPYVTLCNLPEQPCTIRIYSLGGFMVRRFDHELGTYEYWDLLNEHGSLVASGVYIVHIEVPDLGNKILKLAILQPER
ncbi:MAG: hypothetical protein HQ556_11920 [Candidatus Marinimicrobia bacterium]|nr:hypothetical protein [Candidatus Neomarinimicrobiota bacterium]